MKAFLYLLGSLTLLAAALTMALLPRLSPSLWFFVIGGGLLSGLIAGAWTLLSATAGTWPRVRTGPVLVAAGLLAAGLGLADRWWAEVAWGIVGVLVGIPLWVAARRARARDGGPEPFGVRPPLGRRDPDLRA
ncbi:MAG TPA: hypothetical protein VNT75_23570 [Symbiobacteriaceae bacterium]|nr:hypothetical protein [Symbiobacteriaceae bacterium]